MLCDHCGDCYELLTDVRMLNTLQETTRTILRSKNAFLAVDDGGEVATQPEVTPDAFCERTEAARAKCV